jgi:hypothetical protein
MGKTSLGARAAKLSEPMWTLTLELHTGPVAEGHDQRPDTRPIEVPACEQPSEESPRNTGGIHTRPTAIRCADLKASLGEIDRQNMNVGHVASPLIAPDWRSLASYDAGRRGHPPHQFIPLAEPALVSMSATTIMDRAKRIASLGSRIRSDNRKVVALDAG